MAKQDGLRSDIVRVHSHGVDDLPVGCGPDKVLGWECVQDGGLFLAPNEFYIDTTAPDAAGSRHVSTVAIALSRADSLVGAATDLVFRFREGQTHTWAAAATIPIDRNIYCLAAGQRQGENDVPAVGVLTFDAAGVTFPAAAADRAFGVRGLRVSGDVTFEEDWNAKFERCTFALLTATLTDNGNADPPTLTIAECTDTGTSSATQHPLEVRATVTGGGIGTVSLNRSELSAQITAAGHDAPWFQLAGCRLVIDNCFLSTNHDSGSDIGAIDSASAASDVSFVTRGTTWAATADSGGQGLFSSSGVGAIGITLVGLEIASAHTIPIAGGKEPVDFEAGAVTLTPLVSADVKYTISEGATPRAFPTDIPLGTELLYVPSGAVNLQGPGPQSAGLLTGDIVTASLFQHDFGQWWDASTTDATPTLMTSETIGPPGHNSINTCGYVAKFTGHDGAGSQFTAEVRGTVEVGGAGALTKVGVESIDTIHDTIGGGGLVGVTVAVSGGTTLVPQVTGVAATTIAWRCYMTLLET